MFHLIPPEIVFRGYISERLAGNGLKHNIIMDNIIMTILEMHVLLYMHMLICIIINNHD